MNYLFYEESGSGWVHIGTFNLDIWSRPQIGQEIEILGKSYSVSHCVPSDNPDNAQVTYYCVRI